MVLQLVNAHPCLTLVLQVCLNRLLNSFLALLRRTGTKAIADLEAGVEDGSSRAVDSDIHGIDNSRVSPYMHESAFTTAEVQMC